MNKVATSITLDPQLKSSAQALFDDLGLDLSSAVTLFLKQAVREQAIPFRIGKDFPNETTVAALNEYSEMKNNKEKYKRYSSFSEILDEVK